MKNKNLVVKTMKSKKISKLNLFKIAAIVIIILFILIVAGGLFKMHQSRSSFVKLDETQINSAKNIVIEDLEAKGKNISDYQIKVMPRARMIGHETKEKIQEKNLEENSQKKSIVEVEISLFKSKEVQFYLIDINSGEILMHSETNFYTEDCPGFNSFMTSKEKSWQKNDNDDRWFHGGLFK